LQPNITRDIVKLDNQAGFEADDKQVLLPHRQSLSNDELEFQLQNPIPKITQA
jgi:hypothetical protein